MQAYTNCTISKLSSIKTYKKETFNNHESNVYADHFPPYSL